MTIRRLLPLAAALAVASLLSVSEAARAVTVTVGNGIYTVSVEDGTGTSFGCGEWTAVTGPTHPAGPGLNVLFGGGFPGTSDTTFRSYSSGRDYRTSGGGGCVDICTAAAAINVDLLSTAGVDVGVRIEWIVIEPTGNTENFLQEVVVEGPVDGTETVDNTVIRETHTVRNQGPFDLEFGLRKMWDWQIGSDDGPWLGSCEAATVACDRSMNLTADGSEDGPYPASVVINEQPAESGCPGAVVPIDPDGCVGAPVYLVAATVSGASGLTPPPTPPELYQFNAWGNLVGTCWEPTLRDNAYCDFGDTAAAYFYGRTAATAIHVPVGEERSFTQYVVASEDITCPSSFDPCEPVEPSVRTQGFWKRQCRGFHPSLESEHLADYLASVSAVAPFTDVRTVEDVCDRLTPDPREDKCEQAEGQLMAMLLNVASDRVRTCNCVDDPDLGMLTVGDVITALSELLASPDRTFEDCVLAQAVADRINNGWTLVDCPEDPGTSTVAAATSLRRPRERLVSPAATSGCAPLEARPLVHSLEDVLADEAAHRDWPSVIELKLGRPDIAPVPPGR